MTLSSSTLSVDSNYKTAVSSPKSRRRKKNEQSPNGFMKKFGKDGMAVFGDNLAEGMEQSARFGSLNIAVGMDKSSKNVCKTANDYLDFFKFAFGAVMFAFGAVMFAFGAWFLVHVFGSENQLAVLVAISLLLYALSMPLQMGSAIRGDRRDATTTTYPHINLIHTSIVFSTRTESKHDSV